MNEYTIFIVVGGGVSSHHIYPRPQ